MKQLAQNYRTGELRLIEAPAPQVRPGGVLVRNVNSVVSLGTEKLMMDFAKKNLVAKAITRPDLTKQVINLVKTEGVKQAYQEAVNRLDLLEPLGYSSAGEVIEVGKGVDEFKVGDRVSCAKSGFASHAEIISVPKNLCAKVPDNVDFESAAFATLGAISLHAIRLCELNLGENLAIIGLGLLGQIAVQLAKASGCKVFGMDVRNEKLFLAQRLGADGVALTGKEAIDKVRSFCRGYKFDAVLILASTKSNQPLEIAAEICREKGKIVVPGMVKLNVPRESFYQKELNLIVSRAWGPGFDDTSYELKSIDYPYSYVRWTKRRNMEQFLELLGEDMIQLKPLITHRFKIDEAEEAYKAIEQDKSGKYIGVLLCYDREGRKTDFTSKIQLKKELKKTTGKINVGLIGAGAFATTTMLPSIKKLPSINLRGVATATGASGKHAGDKFGFEFCTTDYKEILQDPDIGCVLIATRHNLHAKLVVEALNHGKDIFVEKPLALSKSQLNEIVTAYKHNSGRLMVGFNRRFSSFSFKAKEFLEKIKEPIIINYRVNAGFIPKESWVHDPSEGGGRIIGEVCHFVDLAQFLTGSLPVKVYADSLSDTGIFTSNENVAVTITFKNGSLASIIYTANGDKFFPKERVEIFGGGSVCVIDNFKTMIFTKGDKRRKVKKFNRDMGYRAEFSIFFSSIKQGKELPVDFEEYLYITLVTFAIEESLSKRTPIEIKPKGDLGSLI